MQVYCVILVLTQVTGSVHAVVSVVVVTQINQDLHQSQSGSMRYVLCTIIIYLLCSFYLIRQSFLSLSQYIDGRFIHTLCQACSSYFRKGYYCPVCYKIYKNDDTDKPMVCCDSCDCWLHIGMCSFAYIALCITAFLCRV